MSTEDPNSSEQEYRLSYQTKLAVHERDQYMCLCCRETFVDTSELDVDHVVPSGQGGSNTTRNQVSECRRCHEAKHGERDHAPTVRFTSTGDMIQKDFRWYRHLWNEMIPALAEAAVDHRVEPVFNIADGAPYQAWHIPVGDLRRIDELLAQIENVNYAPRGAHHYM